MPGVTVAPRTLPPGMVRQEAPAAPSVRDLLAVLDAQDVTHEQLGEIAEARRAALAEADSDRLSELNEQEQPLIARARKLEAARLQVLRPWVALVGGTAETVTIGQLCDHVDAAAAATLVVARDRLLVTTERLAELNRLNADLLQACIDSVNASLEHLLYIVQVNPRYAVTGGRADQAMVSRLTDLKA